MLYNNTDACRGATLTCEYVKTQHIKYELGESASRL